VDPVILSGNIHVSPQSSIDAGMSLDGNSIQWWLTQSEGARKSLARPGISLEKALDRLDCLVEITRPRSIWAKHPGFDVTILDSAYQLLRRRSPWPHYTVRFLRSRSLS
jgi:hypothetical protein